MVENVVVFRNTHSSGYKDEGDCRPKCELREHPVKLDKISHKDNTDPGYVLYSAMDSFFNYDWFCTFLQHGPWLRAVLCHGFLF
jgi:hypothetical protein